MPVVKLKPTSPGRRAMVKVVTPTLHKGAPVASLIEPKKRGSGRNNLGHITTRHRGGGHKRHYRIVDFRRNKDGIPARVERLEYDPNRSAHLALLLYADGERRYILAPRGVSAGAELMSGSEAPIRAGNTLPIRNIPVGSTIHNIEMQPGKGGQIARSPVVPHSCWRVKASTHRFVCVPARSVASTSSAVQPWAKSATASTACARSARPVPPAGVVSARRSVALP